MKLGTILRLFLAIWLGKAVFLVSRLLKKNGTTLPGAVALKVCPGLIKYLAQKPPKGAILVTGTNGKTTTSNMLAHILKQANLNFTFNQAGANLITGITTALLTSTRWNGRFSTELALLEVDEATIGKVAHLIKPNQIVITNFFRDQLDRYGELDTTVALVQASVTGLPDTTLVLNADDPLVAQFGEKAKKAVYYGIAPTDYSSTESSQAREAKFCSRCGEGYVYELYHYGQLGIYHCPNCGFSRPNPDVLAESVQLHGLKGISFSVRSTDFNVRLQGFYNIYNALAAATAALNLGIEIDTIRTAIASFVPQAGRMEQFSYGTNLVTLSLVKNPTGFNEVIRAINQGDKPLALLIAINDNAADGRDISWLWDVDFEQLSEHAQWVICAGIRAEDMAVRLKYAGIAPDKLSTIKELPEAFATFSARLKPSQEAYVFPTYTALYPMRQLMQKSRSKANAS